MTGFFRSLARRASGQGGWIRPVLAPVVVPEAAPLVETAEETIAPAHPVDHARPVAVEAPRQRFGEIEEASRAPEETRAVPVSTLVRSLRGRRALPAAEELAVPGPAVRPPPLVRTGEHSTGDTRRVSPVPEPNAARPADPFPLETAPEPPHLPASDGAPAPGWPAPAPASIPHRHLARSTAHSSIAGAEPRAAAPENRAPPAVRGETVVGRPAARTLHQPVLEPIAIPAPRSSGQVVKVTIGRVEVRAPAPPAPLAPRPAPRPVPLMSLADYLRERGGRS